MKILEETDTRFVAQTRVTNWIWLPLGYAAAAIVGIWIGVPDLDMGTRGALSLAILVGFVGIFAAINYKSARLVLDKTDNSITAQISGMGRETLAGQLDQVDQVGSQSWRGGGTRASKRTGPLRHAVRFGGTDVVMPADTLQEAQALVNRINGWQRRR